MFNVLWFVETRPWFHSKSRSWTRHTSWVPVDTRRYKHLPSVLKSTESYLWLMVHESWNKIYNLKTESIFIHIIWWLKSSDTRSPRMRDRTDIVDGNLKIWQWAKNAVIRLFLSRSCISLSKASYVVLWSRSIANSWSSICLWTLRFFSTRFIWNKFQFIFSLYWVPQISKWLLPQRFILINGNSILVKPLE